VSVVRKQAMRRVRAILVILCCAACDSRRREHDAPFLHALTSQDVAGTYGAWGHIGYLELDPNGGYECWIFNGISSDGCADVQGAGVSSGTWALRDGVILFTPAHESRGVVLSLIGASAVPTEQGLLVTAQGQQHVLPREAAEAATAPQADGPNDSR